MMRARSFLAFTALFAGTTLAIACGKEPETPTAEASADADALAVDAWAPDVGMGVADAAPPVASASSSGTAMPAVMDGGSGPGSGALTTTTSSTGPTVTEADADKTIDLAKGQTLTVLLAGNVTTGYDWTVTKSPKALGTPDSSYLQGGAPGVVGAPGKRKLVFTLKDALPPGEHSVELGYARGFEKGVAPFKTFKFKVRAAKP